MNEERIPDIKIKSAPAEAHIFISNQWEPIWAENVDYKTFKRGYYKLVRVEE